MEPFKRVSPVYTCAVYHSVHYKRYVVVDPIMVVKVLSYY